MSMRCAAPGAATGEGLGPSRSPEYFGQEEGLLEVGK